MTRIAPFAGLIMLATALPAIAYTPASEARLAATQARLARQDTRIDAGMQAGRITAHEAARLDAQQGRIDSRSDRLAADGRYSRRDYASVSALQRRSRLNIAFANRNHR